MVDNFVTLVPNSLVWMRLTRLTVVSIAVPHLHIILLADSLSQLIHGPSLGSPL